MRIANNLPPQAPANQMAFKARICKNKSPEYIQKLVERGEMSLRDGFTGLNPIIDRLLEAKQHDQLSDHLASNRIKNIAFDEDETSYIKKVTSNIKELAQNGETSLRDNEQTKFFNWLLQLVKVAE